MNLKQPAIRASYRRCSSARYRSCLFRCSTFRRSSDLGVVLPDVRRDSADG